MLKKTTSGEAATAMGCGDPQAPSPPTTKVTNGGRPSSLLLSTRTHPSIFSMDAPMCSPTSMAEQSKNPPCSIPRNGCTGRSGSSHCRGGMGSTAAGLAGLLVAGEADEGCRNNGRVLLGMRLRVQLPPPPGKGLGDLPGSPIEFGVKNRDAQLALLSPVQRSPLSSAARAARRSEVEELAEDYTCVIARGPNPKMTHIFEDRVVESRAGAGGDKDSGGDACSPPPELLLWVQEEAGAGQGFSLAAKR
ncbi:FCS-Like Zinc finger 8-like [Phragmites australis]|uniref:FCS-Like Zinc finger 8-like n=1 Tax=Phragmites australis TaxID=29695 RepID=UPI002D769F33|nr:FCS-Like Zinc finger 8-like [Phragmites australis]